MVDGLASRRALACVALALLAAAPARAGDGPVCKLCLDAPAASSAEEQPLSIEISAGIQFSRLALTGRGDGAVRIDPLSGAKRVDQGLIDLGGFALSGRGRITGTPLRAVRISLPGSVTMRSPEGATAELTELVTDLSATPVLDASGALEFSFGGRLNVTGASGGNFRGRIPISVEYD